MFVQIPVFFGFYRMLQSAGELRQQEVLWVTDLSQPDTLYTFDLPFSLPFLGNELPLNILPIVMAATMAKTVSEKLGSDVNVPKDDMPQFVAALGAAILGQRRLEALQGEQMVSDPN